LGRAGLPENVEHDTKELHYSDKNAHIPMAEKPDF